MFITIAGNFRMVQMFAYFEHIAANCAKIMPYENFCPGFRDYPFLSRTATLSAYNAIVRSRWEDRKKNVNITFPHMIVTQLMPIDWQWKRASYTRNSASYNTGKYSKLKNHPLSKAYRRVVCVPVFVSAFCDVNSTWLLHDINWNHISEHLIVISTSKYSV